MHEASLSRPNSAPVSKNVRTRKWAIIGFSANSRTILKFKDKLALAHPHYVCEQVKKAIEVIIITKK